MRLRDSVQHVAQVTIGNALVSYERIRRGAAYSPFDKRLYSDPYPLAQNLSERDPVHRCWLMAGWVLTRYDAVLAQWNESRAELGSVTAQVEKARVRFERSSLLQSKRNWSGLIALTAKSIPDGCWLASLRTDPAVPGPPRLLVTHPTAVDGKTPAPPKPVVIEAPRRLRLTGYASRASEPHMFVANLKATSVFSNVELENMVSASVWNGTYFRYDLLCEW